MATGDGQPIDKRREAGITFQVRGEGVSRDYLNGYMMPTMQCKAFLNKPGFPLAHYGSSEEEIRAKILEGLKDRISYTEYMSYKGKLDGFGLEDFLTERGREIVARLDAIVLELKNLCLLEPENLDVNSIFTLLEEANNLIENQRRF